MVNDTPAALGALASDIARYDARGVAVLLRPFIDWLGEPLVASQVRATVDAAVLVSRALYPQGRAVECLPLARSLLAACDATGEREQTRRAAILCGILATESADLVEALEHHVFALRLAAAAEDRRAMAHAWNSIGHAFVVSGCWELASRSCRRSLALLEPMTLPLSTRYVALCNLAEICYHLGDAAEGIAFGEAALRELEGVGEQDAYGVILLRRSLVRLSLALGRMEEATRHLGEAVALERAAPSRRAEIAVNLTRAALEMAAGNADLALTRLDRTLASARAVPATLHDTLAAAVRAEEATGNDARALMRLEELFDHVNRHAVERTRALLVPAGVDPEEPAAEVQRGAARERLVSRLAPAEAPRSWSALRRLAAGAALRMDETGRHGMRVGALVKALALASGSSPLQALELGLAAEVHDIGMASIPAGILSKKGKLNEAELAIVRRHPEAAAEMLVDDRHPRMLLARDMARFHHARWDGAGWPERVGGASIPQGARLCAVADAYDMMVSGFGGGTPLSMGAALEVLRCESGRQFDPGLVSCFDSLIRGELEGLGIDPSASPGLEDFQELVASLKDDRGFV